MREHFGTASYNALQVQLNRRYINGLQFAVAYTFGKTVERRRPDYDTAAARRGLERGPGRRDAVPQPRRSTTPGTCRTAAGCGTTRSRAACSTAGSSPATPRSSAATGRGRPRRRPTTSTSPAATAARAPTSRGDPLLQLSGNCDPTPGGGGSYFNIAAFSRLCGPRRHRQRAGHLLPAAEDRAVEHVDLQELPARRRPPDPVPLGGVQRLQPGELVDTQHQRAVQSGRRAGQRELRPGDGRARRARHAGGDSVHLLSRGSATERRPRTNTGPRTTRATRISVDTGSDGGRAILPVSSIELGAARVLGSTRTLQRTEPRMTQSARLVAAPRHSCSIHRRAAQNPHLVVYQGDKGPGAGKHIVWLAGDHEYRGEESLPALARIMARHYGFKCSVFFTTDPEDRVHRAGQLEHLGARGARRPPTSSSSSCASRTFPTTRCSTSSTTWTAAGRSSAIARRRTPFRSSGRTRSS